MQIQFADSRPNKGGALALLSAKDLVLSAAAQSFDEANGGALRRAARVARFEGTAGEITELLAPSEEWSRVLLVGSGPPGRADAASFQRIGGALAAHLLRSGEARLTVDMMGANDLGLSVGEAAAHIALGLGLRGYAFDRYRTRQPQTKAVSLREVTIVGADGGAKAWQREAAMVDAVTFTRDLVSEPPNVIYPESFVERVKALKLPGLRIDVLDRQAMADAGMHALLGVAQGSERPPRLLVMEWDGTDGAAKPSTVFVGKGVTFDSGGISLKPGAGMEDMKWDMGGAGAVAGAMVGLAMRGAKARVVGICGLVENMPDGKAQRPGDVVTTMSGQTVEVINTDAEGRLVLCDALWWAQETYRPEVIVDLATLTGAMIVSLGHEYGGMFSNDNGLADDLARAGQESGDKLWRMPLGERYDKQIDSQIADMKNVGGKDAGSITAAQFLQRFIQDGVKWAHLDVAGMVWSAKAGTLHDKGATGYGVRLIDRYVRNLLER